MYFWSCLKFTLASVAEVGATSRQKALTLMDGRREYVKLRLKITGASFSYQVCVVCSAVESNENGLNAAVPEEALDQHNRTVLVQTRYAAPASRGCLQN